MNHLLRKLDYLNDLRFYAERRMHKCSMARPDDKPDAYKAAARANRVMREIVSDAERIVLSSAY